MARARPLKPAKRDAVAVFPKSGGVRVEQRDWPRIVQQQEMEAAEAFREALEARTGRRLVELRPTEGEADHDVEAQEGGQRVQIQVTELVTRDHVTQSPRGYFQVDRDGLDGALERTVSAKLAKPMRGS